MNKHIAVLDKGFVKYIDHMGSDQRIVETARVSYASTSKGAEKDKKLLNFLYKERHTSPFESCMISFNIKLPLFVQGQMVRHRTQKLNQVSARYTEMPDEFYFPESLRKQDSVNKQGSVDDGYFNPFVGYNESATQSIKDVCTHAYSTYKAMVDAGVAREMARMVLPQNLYTEIRTTWDLHNLMHFLTLRMDHHAQKEVQEYANAMYEITKELFPQTIGAFDRYKWKVTEEH